MNGAREAPFRFEVGGSLPADSPTYVVRAVDQELYTALRNGQLCYVLNARQMGKSSLRVRTMERLRADGIACADVDLSIPGSEQVSPDEWYAGVADILVSRFQLFPDFGLEEWWKAHVHLSPVQRLAKLFEDVVLVRVPGEVVVFFDEIDTVLGLGFGDDFFALLRACHDLRATRSEYRRLTFVLIGVATPSELIRERHRSPFNIGRAIPMDGFRIEEARPALLPGLAAKLVDAEAVLREILDWTGGQPFLTQRLCKIAVTTDSLPQPGDEAQWLAELVCSRVTTDWESQDQPVHLRTIRDRILENNSGRTGRLLGLYQKILEREESAIDDSPEQMDLRLSGLVVDRDGRLQVANRIYASIFDLAWVRRKLAEIRPYAPSIEEWLASDRKDASFLLAGEALRRAREWAAGKSLGDADYQFLEASSDRETQRIEADLKAEREANQVLQQAKRRAQRITAFGATVLILTLILSVGVLLVIRQRALSTDARAQAARAEARDAQEKVRMAADELRQQQKISAQLQKSIAALKARRQALESSLRDTRIHGEAAIYVPAIGQDRANLLQAEMEVFQRLAQAEEEVRLDFIRQALDSKGSATRLGHRIELASQAVVGLSPETRARLLGEIVLPCLRERTRPLEIRQVCAALALEIGANSPGLASLVLPVIRENRTIVWDAEDAENLTGRLAALARILPSSQVPEIFEWAVAATERAMQLDSSAFDGKLPSGISRNLIEIARLLRDGGSENAVRRVLATVRRMDSDSKGLWNDLLAAIPGSPSLDLWTSSLSDPDVREAHVTLTKKVVPEAAAEFFQQIALVEEFHGRSLLDHKLILAEKLSPEFSAKMLVQLVSEVAAQGCLAVKSSTREGITAVAPRAEGAGKARALEILLANRKPAFQAVVTNKLASYPGLECWARMVNLVGGDLRGQSARAILEELIEPARKDSSRSASEATALLVARMSPGQAEEAPLRALLEELAVRVENYPGVTGKALVSIASRMERSAAEELLLQHLEAATQSEVILWLIEALGSHSGRFSPEASRAILAKVEKDLPLSMYDSVVDFSRSPRGLSGFNRAMGRLDPEIAQKAAEQILADVASSLSGPRLTTQPDATHSQAVMITQPDGKTATAYRQHPALLGSKLRKAAVVLSAMPQGKAVSKSMKVFWPLTAMQLPTDHFAELAGILELVPGSLQATDIQALLEICDRSFCDPSETRPLAVAVMKKVAPPRRWMAADLILRAMEKQPLSVEGLLGGLGSQQGGLGLQEIQRAFAVLISVYTDEATRIMERASENRESIEDAIQARISMLTRNAEDGRLQTLEKDWMLVARQIRPKEALRGLEIFASIALRSTNPYERKLALQALPFFARKVPPESSRQAFLILAKFSGAESRADASPFIAKALTGLRGKVPPRDLFDLLRQPQCIGALRSAALAGLERETGQRFQDDLWKAVAWARAARLNLSRAL